MIRIERIRRKDLATHKCWWLHQVISNNIVVTNIVKFRLLLLILNKIYFRVCNYNQLVCLHIKTFDISTLSYYNYISQLEDMLQTICFYEHDTQLCFYNEESCHKINTFWIYFTTPLSLLYTQCLIQISSCSLAVLWPEKPIFDDDADDCVLDHHAQLDF